MLDEQRNEPFEAAENRAVDDHRTVLCVIGADVGEVEALGLHVVELNRRALPLPADGIGDVEVDLRPVKSPVAFVERVRRARRLQRALQLGFGVIPRFDGAEELRAAEWTASSRVSARNRHTHAAPTAAAARLPLRFATP